MVMKTNWIAEFLASHDYEFERNIGENEVWRNKLNLIVVHPTSGIKLMYRLDLFNEDYTESVIEGDLIAHDRTIASKIKSTPPF